MIYRNIYLYEWKLFKIKLLKENDYENGPFVASVKIGLKAKTKKKVQDNVTSSYKLFFLVKNGIINLIQKTGLFNLFSS